MPSIAEYKRQAMLRRGLKKDPGLTLAQLFGGNKPDFVEAAIEQALPAILRDIVARLVASKEFNDMVVGTAMARIGKPAPGKPGTPGYTPKKGIDYLTKTEVDALIADILSRIPPAEKGKDADESAVVARVLAQIPPPQKIDVEGKDIIAKVNALPIEPALQIDAKHIKNLPKGGKESTALHRGGIKLVWNTQLDGTINGVNTVFTIPASLPDPKDNKYLVSARGVLKDVDSGDFTISNNNRTITFASAPPNGSARPRILLYHGK